MDGNALVQFKDLGLAAVLGLSAVGSGWGAGVAGSGALKRTDVGGTVNVNFQGAAAGSYTGTSSGNFSGTGAGTSK